MDNEIVVVVVAAIVVKDMVNAASVVVVVIVVVVVVCQLKKKSTFEFLFAVVNVFSKSGKLRRPAKIKPHFDHFAKTTF